MQRAFFPHVSSQNSSRAPQVKNPCTRKPLPEQLQPFIIHGQWIRMTVPCPDARAIVPRFNYGECAVCEGLHLHFSGYSRSLVFTWFLLLCNDYPLLIILVFFFFVFVFLACRNSLYSLDISHLFIWVANIFFFGIVACLFTLWYLW